MIGDLTATLTVLVAVLVAIAGYVRFLLVRATIGAHFDVELTPLGQVNGTPSADLSCVVTNLSSNVLEVTGIRVRVRYTKGEDGQFAGDPLEPAFSGQLRTADGDQWLVFYPFPRSRKGARTVVFQGGNQAYRKPLSFPGCTGVVSVWASCDYRVRVSRFTRWLVKVILRPAKDLDFSEGLGNHQVRRTFRIDTSS